jgi:RNA polymerase sigma-70 factor (ECF subfamily)
MDKQEDNIVIEQILAGNARLFETLVKKYQKQVFNLAFRMLGLREEAQDVAQSAFVKAYENLGSFNFESKFFSWIYRIAINECINAQKRQARFENADENNIETLATNCSDAATDLEDKEQTVIINKAVTELRDDYRALIILKYYDNFSYEEIAQTLEIPVGKVKSRLFSARQSLKEKLIREGIFQ